MGGADGIKDRFYYISEDKINDLLVLPIGGEMIKNSVLACEDTTI